MEHAALTALQAWLTQGAIVVVCLGIAGAVLATGAVAPEHVWKVLVGILIPTAGVAWLMWLSVKNIWKRLKVLADSFQ